MMEKVIVEIINLTVNIWLKHRLFFKLSNHSHCHISISGLFFFHVKSNSLCLPTDLHMFEKWESDAAAAKASFFIIPSCYLFSIVQLHHPTHSAHWVI